MPSADAINPQGPPAGLTGLRLRSRPAVAGGPPAGLQAPAHPVAVTRQASTHRRVGRGRGPAAVQATARWLRRAFADSARAWALAAGVPPDLYH